MQRTIWYVVYREEVVKYASLLAVRRAADFGCCTKQSQFGVKKLLNDNPYLTASSRSDLSQWVVHFVRSVAMISPSQVGTAADILHSILVEGQIRPSIVSHITRYCQTGATCFYDAPPNAWPEIVRTNPNARQPLGLIVQKKALWYLGGRPAIYTEKSTPEYWPPQERYRIVYTDLLRNPHPADWMHEREWRLPGPLSLHQPNIQYTWWWPVVPTLEWLPYIWNFYMGVHWVYVMSSGNVCERPGLH